VDQREPKRKVGKRRRENRSRGKRGGLFIASGKKTSEGGTAGGGKRRGGKRSVKGERGGGISTRKQLAIKHGIGVGRKQSGERNGKRELGEENIPRAAE